MLRFLEKPKKNPNVYSVVAWTDIARQISINIAEMGALERWGLVDSDWHVGLGLVLPGIFDKLIEPKLTELTTFSLKSEDTRKGKSK